MEYGKPVTSAGLLHALGGDAEFEAPSALLGEPAASKEPSRSASGRSYEIDRR
jgi:hypothetical protein